MNCLQSSVIKVNEIKSYPVEVIILEDNYEILKHSSFAIACSGTVTLELVLFKIPTVAVYKTDFVSALIGRMLVNFKNVILPNFLLKKNIAIISIIILFISYFNPLKALEKISIINNFNSAETLKFDFAQESFDKNEKGVCFLSKPILSSEGIAKVCFCMDPNGTRIELVEML